jgi:hypothetical protein
MMFWVRKENVQPKRIFRQFRSIALQKKPFAIRYSPFAAVLGSAGASPSHDFDDQS